jgi:hypothetical protein
MLRVATKWIPFKYHVDQSLQTLNERKCDSSGLGHTADVKHRSFSIGQRCQLAK